MKIFQNKFKLINLYRLWHLQALTFETDKDDDHIGIEDGMLKLWKISGTYKDYGTSFYKVWSEVFISYILFMVSLFEIMAPRFQAALTQFYGFVSQLSKVYDLKRAMLPQAIKVVIFIVI